METNHLKQYRDTVLNVKSASFCGAKWGNSTLWLNTGETASCHLPPVHDINIEQISKIPSKLHNTDHKIAMRKLMQVGKRPPECDYCWNIEDMGDDYISDRVFKSTQFNDDELEEWYNNNTDLIIPPTIEIMFDRPCNFACCYCNANFSTAWAKDINDNGFYDLESPGGAAFKHNGNPNNAWEDKENPFIEAFWKWWPELHKKLRILRVTGGEPLLSTHVWKLMDLYIDEHLDFELSLNSNLGVSDANIDKLIQKSKSMKNLTMFSSMETTGKHAEYTRFGLDYEKWCHNVERILTEANVQRLTIMFTINALCLFNLVEFLDQMMVWKHQVGRHKLGLSINFLRFPALMSVTVLPTNIRNRVADELDKWYTENKDDSELSEYELRDIERLLEYIRVIKIAHVDDADLEVNRRDFKNFFKQYDKRRGTDINVFPDYFLDWFNK